VKKVDISVGSLVEMISRGELRLPEMQRRYVWRSTRVRDLLDSLYRGYPSGAILVWETDEEVPVRDVQVDQAPNAFSTTKLLLDGQQRLTSLSAVLGGKQVKIRSKSGKTIDILFNLDHPDTSQDVEEVEEDLDDDEDEDAEDLDDEDDDVPLPERLRRLTFVVASKSMAGLPNWVSVTSVFRSAGDAPFLKSAGVTSFDDPKYARYTDRLRRLREIRNYPYVMHLLDRNLGYEEVAEIFVRVNSLGVKLRSHDLALAQITSRWRNLLPELEKFQAECEEQRFTIDTGMLVRSMVVHASGQSRFKTLARISTPKLREGWARAKEGLHFAVNFLASNGRVEDESLLSSPFFLPALSYAYERAEGRFDKEAERALLRWVLIGSGRGYFSGSSETKLDADLARLRRGEGPPALLQNLEQQFGRLHFVESDIARRGERSGLYGLVYLALKGRGAKDWRTGLEISLRHRGHKHLIQSHHIFPKARIRESYEKAEVNEIANRAFIGGGTNRQLYTSIPAEYLPDILKQRGKQAVEAQCVPLEPELWRPEMFPSFLEARRRALVAAINEMVS